MNENRECTKAMAAVEKRFCGNQKRTAVITQDEFRAISNYIETLEDSLVFTKDCVYNLSQENANLWFEKSEQVYQ